MPYVPLLVAPVVALVLLSLFYRLAPRWGLMDLPSRRKQHLAPVPLVGGLAIFGAFAVATLALPAADGDRWWLLAAGSLLVAVGARDDQKGLRPLVRLLAQIVAALCMTLGAGVKLTSLGTIFTAQPIELGLLAVPFTIFAAVGVINAANMSDGIDGLAGGFVLVAAIALGGMALAADRTLAAWPLLLGAAALVPFLFFNIFGTKGDGKVFLGDAGSTFLGFLVAWFLVDLSQGNDPLISPSAALWIYAVPVMDAVGLIVIRLQLGYSPLLPDRLHFHHLLLACGFGARQTLVILTLIALFMATVGVSASALGIPDETLFLGFCALFAITFAFRIQTTRLMSGKGGVLCTNTQCSDVSPSLEPVESPLATAASRPSPRNSEPALPPSGLMSPSFAKGTAEP